MDIVWGGIIGPDPSGCEVTLVDNGTDWGARINAADVALGAKAGAICCYGGGNIATQIILNSGASSLRTLRFGAGTWTSSAFKIGVGGVETILPHDDTLIEGHGWDTILQEPQGRGTMLVPGTPSLVAHTFGGTLATGTYYYKVTALDGNGGGETTPTGEASVAVTGPTGSVDLTWAGSFQLGLQGVIHYRIYRGTSPDAENVYYLRPFTSQGNETYTDTGAAATAGTPPSMNTAKTNDPLSYFLMRPWATSQIVGSAQVNNISMRNMQLLGMPGKSPSATSATVDTGLLIGGTYENLWFNKTTAIGMEVGETTDQTSVCKNVTVRGCKFTNVGGGVPPDFPTGGGVTLAVVSGDNITVSNCTFQDALGNTVIDIEPNSIYDPATNIRIENCLIAQDNATGMERLPAAYGFAAHTQGAGPVGPIQIYNCTFRGTHDDGGGGNPNVQYAGPSLINAVYVNYGSTGGQSYQVDVQNCDIRFCNGAFIVIDSANDNIVKNNFMLISNQVNTAGSVIVAGLRNVIQNNQIYQSTGKSSNYLNGIVERSPNTVSDYNSFVDNKATLATQYGGTHDTFLGEIVVPPYQFP